MKSNILSFVNKLEGYKTAIKNLHWSSNSMSEHKLFDEIADSVAGIQDEISEIEQGLHGQVTLNQVKGEKYEIKSSKQFLADLLSNTKAFYKTLKGDEYIGIRSYVEAFIGDVSKFQYLLNLCLKEDLQRRLKKGAKAINESRNPMITLTEGQFRQIVEESVKRILNNKR